MPTESETAKLRIESAVTGNAIEQEIPCYEATDSIERKAKYLASAIKTAAWGSTPWEFNPGDTITIIAPGDDALSCSEIFGD